jgi:hypothetical protein
MRAGFVESVHAGLHAAETASVRMTAQNNKSEGAA